MVANFCLEMANFCIFVKKILSGINFLKLFHFQTFCKIFSQSISSFDKTYNFFSSCNYQRTIWYSFNLIFYLAIHFIMDCLHWQSLLAKPLVTATCDSHHCTYLGHCGRRNIKKKWSYLCHATQGGQGKYSHMSLMLALLC